MSITVGGGLGVRISGGIVVGPSVGVSLSGNDYVNFLLRDDFTTAEAAPLTSPRTAEPGPGTLTLVQNDGQFVITSKPTILLATFDADNQSFSDAQVLDTLAEGISLGALTCVIVDGTLEIA